MNNDDKLSTFIAMTNPDDSFDVKSFLSSRSWNVEQSVEDFFNGDLSIRDHHETTGRRGKKRKQSSSSTSSTLDYEQERLRAPRPMRSDKMLDTNAMFATRIVPTPREDPFRSSSNALMKKANLASLFAPPEDILTTGGFEDARDVARASSKWLLVNIQHFTEFASHQLNRDTWKNSEVKTMIKRSFIFWQASHDGNDGTAYCSLYSLNSQTDLPHIAVIDPHTRQRVLHYSGRLILPDELLHDLNAFLDKNGMPVFNSQSTIEEHSISSFSSSSSRKSASSGTSKKSRVEMTEEEMLADAIAASLADDDDVVVSAENKEEKKEEVVQVPEEPATGGIAVQVVLPTGKKMRRRFHNEDTIHMLYAYALQEVVKLNEMNSNKTVNDFTLKCAYPKLTLDTLTSTLASCKLHNAVIRMEWN